MHTGTLEPRVAGSSVALLPPRKLLCLIVSDPKGDPPPSLNLFYSIALSLVVLPLLFAHCVAIGEVISLPPP